jgi:hypothetical protein
MARRSPARHGMTLVEAMLGVLLMSIALGLVFVAFSTTADVLSVTQATTRSHLDAERCLRLCLAELRRATRDTTESPRSPSWSGSGLQTDDPDDAIEFRQVTGVDPADPRTVLRGDRLLITFEQDGDEVPQNDVDDDRDGAVDEGRVAIYRVGAPNQLIAVLAHEVSRFVVEVDQPTEDVLRVSIEVRVEQVIDRAVRSDDAGAVATGGGPRRSHVACGSLTLLN